MARKPQLTGVNAATPHELLKNWWQIVYLSTAVKIFTDFSIGSGRIDSCFDWIGIRIHSRSCL